MVVVLEECSLELLLGQPLFELEDDVVCSVVVAGAGATTTGTGAYTTGAGYTVTTAGAGAVEVVVSLVVVSELWANPTPTVPNSTAIPKDKAAVLKECFTIMSPLVLKIRGSASGYGCIRLRRNEVCGADCCLSALEN